MTADILNPNVTASNSFDSAPVSKQDFGTPMYLAAPGSLGVGFTESVRYYSDSTGIATDLASGDLTQEATDALNVGLSQSPRPNLVACGNVPGAVSKVTGVGMGGVVTNGDVYSVIIDPAGDAFTATYTAVVPTDDADAVIIALVASALINVPSRYAFAADGDSLTVTDLLKGADVTVTASVVGVGLIVAGTDSEPSGAAEGHEISIDDEDSGIGDVWSILFDGIDVSYTQVSAVPAAEDIVAALVVAINALDSSHLAFSTGTATFIITSDFGAVSINAVSGSTTGLGGVSVTEVQAATPIGPLMDALFFADSGWYGLVSQVKTQGMSLDLGAWNEPNKRFYMSQESDPGLLTAEATSTGALFKALAYARSVSDHHPTDADELMFGIMAGKLAVDPDVAVTTWAYARAIGISPDLTVTTTQRAALESTYTGFYNSIRGRSAYWEGKTADGNYIDTLISRDWFNARLAEAVTNVIVSASQRGSKIPFTDSGIQQIANVVRAFLFGTAIRIGHIERILDDNNNVVSPTVTPPRRSKVSAADVTARLIRIPYTANLTGAIHKANIDGYVTTNLVTGEVTVS